MELYRAELVATVENQSSMSRRACGESSSTSDTGAVIQMFNAAAETAFGSSRSLLAGGTRWSWRL